MQLIEATEDFTELDVNIATITYDSIELLKEVQEDEDVSFPLLHDEDVTHVNAVGIRNLDYEPGQRSYGIPYPGIFLINPEGIIVQKFAEESFRDRPDLEVVLEAAASL